MFPCYFPPKDKLTTDVDRVTNLLYFAPIDHHRRTGDWCTEVLSGEHPKAFHRDGRQYQGQGNTYKERILDLVRWLDDQ